MMMKMKMMAKTSMLIVLMLLMMKMMIKTLMLIAWVCGEDDDFDNDIDGSNDDDD
ncbi:hypothetical protein BgiBS90_002929, partial [Biomphalaria glabrata]